MAFDLKKWRHLIDNVPMLSIKGWATGNYLGRSSTSLANENPTCVGGWMFSPLSASGSLVSFGNNGGTGVYTVYLTGGLPTARKQSEVPALDDLSSAFAFPANRWDYLGANFVSNTSRFIVYQDEELQSTVNITDPTVDFETIGVQRRNAVLLPCDGLIGPVTIWNAVPPIAAQKAMRRGLHPGYVLPGNIIRAWWPYPGFPMGFDFSETAAHLAVTGTLTFAPGPPIVLPQRRVFFAPPAAAGGAVGVGLTESVRLSRLRLAA